jgi:protease I
VVKHFFDTDLPVASVCHGIEILATAGVIRGRTVTTVLKCCFDAEVCGAVFANQEVVVSGNLVTARTWHDNHAFLREFLKLLNGRRRESR